jgi:hypothetical protein
VWHASQRSGVVIAYLADANPSARWNLDFQVSISILPSATPNADADERGAVRDRSRRCGYSAMRSHLSTPGVRLPVSGTERWWPNLAWMLSQVGQNRARHRRQVVVVPGVWQASHRSSVIVHLADV